MELVDIVAGRLARLAVDGDAIPHGVLHDEHPDLFELLSQLLDVEIDDTVVDIDIRLVVEDIEGAGNIDFKRGCDVLRFFFVLLPQLVIEVFKNRHILRLGVAQILPIDQPHTAVDDGLLHRLQAVLAADDQLTEGQNEIGFKGKWVFIIAIIEVQIHWVEVVAGGGRDFDDLPVQALYKRAILRFRVADDDVVIRDEEDIGDLALGGEAFAAARCAEDEPVRVFVKKNFFITGNISRFDML